MIVLAGLVAASAVFATAIIVYAGNSGGTDLPVAIQSVAPEPGDNVLSQADIVVDLAVGYTAELEVNGFAIPEEQLFRVEGLNQVTFKPGPNQILERLRADQNCVQVRYWLIAAGSDDSNLYTWCFEAS